MVECTHDVRVGEETVVKRYRSWERGEPAREWAGLCLLDRYAPGLAPRPLEQRYVEGAPAVVMTRVPGEPLGARPLDRDQLLALAAALRRVHTSVPAGELAELGERRWGPGELIGSVRSWIEQPQPSRTAGEEPREPLGDEVVPALRGAARFVHGPDATALAGPPAEPVFAHADGNLGNILWDGERCSIVDFEDCGASDRAYEIADLVEHVSVWLPGLIEADDLVHALELGAEERRRLLGFRRVMATFWLLMLLPGNPAHHRNPAGSLERQAARVLQLL